MWPCAEETEVEVTAFCMLMKSSIGLCMALEKHVFVINIMLIDKISIMCMYRASLYNLSPTKPIAESFIDTKGLMNILGFYFLGIGVEGIKDSLTSQNAGLKGLL